MVVVVVVVVLVCMHVCLWQLDCSEIVLRTIREVSDMWMTDDGITDVPISLNDCDKLIENYAKHALDFSAADHCNEPGKYCFTHTHACLMALCPGLPGWAGTRKVKPIWILLKQETVSDNGISRAICKSAPRFRQIPRQHPTTQFFTGRMPFLLPNQQCQSPEGTSTEGTLFHVDDIYSNCKLHNRAAVFVLLSYFYVLYGEVVDVTLLMRTFISSLVRD